jgi:hypothetical protein
MSEMTRLSSLKHFVSVLRFGSLFCLLLETQHDYFFNATLIFVVVIVVFSFCIVVLFCVMCVVCVLCLIVVPLPPGENPFAVKINI